MSASDQNVLAAEHDRDVRREDRAERLTAFGPPLWVQAWCTPAPRGSYLQRVWVAPSTVRRVLAAHELDLPAAPPPRERMPWPEWVEYRPNQVWGYDVTHFSRCRRAPNCFAIMDRVSRKWIATLHEADLADDRFDAPEAPGLDVLCRGLSMIRTDDEVLAVAEPLFDAHFEYRRRALMLGHEPA